MRLVFAAWNRSKTDARLFSGPSLFRAGEALSICMKRVIHWFRRDLRLRDNTALFEACRQAEQVFPVFILENAFRTGPDVGAARLLFLLRSANELRDALREIGSELIIRRGDSQLEIPKLAIELKADAVFCNIRYEPYAQKRDERVFNALNELGVGFE